jgi:hypothetical protein
MENDFVIVDKMAMDAAEKFLVSEATLLDCIARVDRDKVYKRFDYASLFVYCTKRLKLSESNAYAFISVARKSQQVPALAEAVANGVLNVSQAKRIVSVIEPENASDWIGKAATSKQRALESEVARTQPAPPIKERVRAVGGDMAEMKLVIPQALVKEVERLQEVRGCSMIEAIWFAVGDTLKRHDPIRKAERNLGKRTQPSSRIVQRTPPAQVRHEVTLRDEARCTHRRPDGSRCENKRWLHFHHERPFAIGGQSNADNLTLLCAQHHRIHHAAG